MPQKSHFFTATNLSLLFVMRFGQFLLKLGKAGPVKHDGQDEVELHARNNTHLEVELRWKKVKWEHESSLQFWTTKYCVLLLSHYSWYNLILPKTWILAFLRTAAFVAVDIEHVFYIERTDGTSNEFTAISILINFPSCEERITFSLFISQGQITAITCLSFLPCN